MSYHPIVCSQLLTSFMAWNNNASELKENPLQETISQAQVVQFYNRMSYRI
jgi:hypothetical protein